MTTQFSTNRMEAPGKVLLISDRADHLQSAILRRALEECGQQTIEVCTLEEAINRLDSIDCEICLIAQNRWSEHLFELSKHLQDTRRNTQFVCVLNSSDRNRDTLPAVAFDAIEQPVTTAKLKQALLLAAGRSRLVAENNRLKRQLTNKTMREMVGFSPQIQKNRQEVLQASEEESVVLIHGEPGSGTELVARSIHEASRRAHRPFLEVTCIVMSTESLDRELFGYQDKEHGQKIGQQQDAGSGILSMESEGRLLQAQGGTLLLKDVDALSLPMQRKLVLRLKENQPLTSGQRLEPSNDVRILATTHIDLNQKVNKGLFREDLCNILQAICIETPTLRGRREDIGPLTEHFLSSVAVKEGRARKSISVDALELLKQEKWPGNVRQLQNVIERACTLDMGPKLTTEMILPWLENEHSDAFDEQPGLTLKEMERKLIETTFARYKGNRERTAQSLKIGLRTLSGKLRDYGYPPRGGPGSNLKPTKQDWAA